MRGRARGGEGERESTGGGGETGEEGCQEMDWCSRKSGGGSNKTGLCYMLREPTTGVLSPHL